MLSRDLQNFMRADIFTGTEFWKIRAIDKY